MDIYLRIVAGVSVFQIFGKIFNGAPSHLGSIDNNIGTDDTAGKIFQYRVVLLRPDDFKVTYIVQIYGNLSDGLCLLQGSADNNIGFIMILF